MEAVSLKRDVVKQLIVNATAIVKCQTPSEIEQNGNIGISAKECMAVIAMIEDQIGREVLTPVDLATPSTKPPSHPNRKPNGGNGCMDPAEDSTVDKLTNIFCSKLGIDNDL